MVRRDRNHPSILMWSIGNEIDYPNDPYADKSDPFYEPTKPDPAELDDIASMLSDWVKELDKTRFVTAAIANAPIANKTGYADVLDIAGYNYQERYYEEDHKNYPERVIYGSENGDNLRGWEAVYKNDYISGQFLWTGLDYHGEAGEFPRHSAPSGLLDMCGFEKPLYYERMSWWSDVPMIKAFAQGEQTYRSWRRRVALMHWNHEIGKDVSVGCYTNCDEAEFFLNGESLGRKEITSLNAFDNLWDIQFSPGTLKVIGYKNGEAVAEDILQTADSLAGFKLETFEEFLTAEDSEIVHVMVQGVDKDEIPVFSADEEVQFDIEGGGEIFAVGNADVFSLESYRGNKRSLYQGKALVVVKSNGENTPVTLSASHGDIISTITIPVRR